MSEMSERARSSAKSKVKRLVAPNKGDVDASGWREPTDELGDVQTGPRPVSRRQFKRGGKVDGDAAKMHAGKKPRKASGGATTVDGGLVNRDVKEANDARSGEKHIGGMKKGGRTSRAHKLGGGAMMGRPELQPRVGNSTTMTPAQRQIAMARPMGKPFASGGATHGAGCACAKCGGGRVAKATGGKLDVEDGAIEGLRPKGDRLARKAGGRAKGKTNINIIIAPSGGGARPPMQPPGAMPPPGSGPVGLHQAPPPQPAAAAAPAPMQPPMMRKSGGRAYPIESGAGGGLGRLEKARAYGRP